VLGTDHPGALATRRNLARFTGEAGNVAGARDQLAVLLTIYERALGAEHHRTLAVRRNLNRFNGRAQDAVPDES
jgi:hypothetical protein